MIVQGLLLLSGIFMVSGHAVGYLQMCVGGLPICGWPAYFRPFFCVTCFVCGILCCMHLAWVLCTALFTICCLLGNNYHVLLIMLVLRF